MSARWKYLMRCALIGPALALFGVGGVAGANEDSRVTEPTNETRDARDDKHVPKGKSDDRRQGRERSGHTKSSKPDVHHNSGRKHKQDTQGNKNRPKQETDDRRQGREGAGHMKPSESESHNAEGHPQESGRTYDNKGVPSAESDDRRQGREGSDSAQQPQ